MIHAARLLAKLHRNATKRAAAEHQYQYQRCQPYPHVAYSKNGSFTCQGDLGQVRGPIHTCLGAQNESAEKMSCRYRNNPFGFYHALNLMSCSAAAAWSAVLWTGLCVLTRFSAESISASLAKRGTLLVVVVYRTSRSKSDRDRSKCYCNGCYSEVFHTRSPLKLLTFVELS